MSKIIEIQYAAFFIKEARIFTREYPIFHREYTLVRSENTIFAREYAVFSKENLLFFRNLMKKVFILGLLRLYLCTLIRNVSGSRVCMIFIFGGRL